MQKLLKEEIFILNLFFGKSLKVNNFWADLFHASNEIVKLLGLSLNRKYAAPQDKIAKATATLSLLIELSKGINEIEKQQLVVNNLNKEQQIIESATSRYKEVLHKLSKIVHPFDITDTSKQTSAQVQILLMELPEVVKKKKLKLTFFEVFNIFKMFAQIV
jgi:hypothetical protein